jgi:hypothetical protein
MHDAAGVEHDFRLQSHERPASVPDFERFERQRQHSGAGGLELGGGHRAVSIGVEWNETLDVEPGERESGGHGVTVGLDL